MKTFELTEESIKIIAHALRTTIRVRMESIDRMYELFGNSDYTKAITEHIVEDNVKMATLLNYIES
jgi:hypothetical protein